MTEQEIAATVDAILVFEGRVFTNDPDDPGLATRYGITAANLGVWRRLGRPATPAEVEALSEAEARAIYRADYIEGPGFDEIADPHVRQCVVDFAVHSGVSRAIGVLQRAVGVAIDFKIGPVTLAAVAAADPARLVAQITRARVELLAGWMRRNPARAKFIGTLTRAVSFLPALG